MNKEDKHLDGAGLGEVWAKVKAQVSVLASGLGQVTAMAHDNTVAITAHDNRITDLESYFDGGRVLKAVGDEDGRNIKATYFPYTGGTIYKSGENYPLVIKGGNLSTVAGIEFYGSTGSLLGRLRFTNSALQYYNGSYRDVYHEGNANLASVDWACKDLNAAQDVIATRGVSAKGCSDLSIAEMTLLKSEFTPNALAVTTKTGTSWTPDNNSTPSIMYQAITSNHTLNFQTADAAGVGCVHYIILANNTSSAKTVTVQRGSQGLAVARVSGSISVPANSALVMTYVALNQNFYVAESSVLTIDHP